MENKKKYKLLQWYPTLPKKFECSDDYEYYPDDDVMHNITNGTKISMRPEELHPDFWQLIEEKKPLFVTEEGVGVFDLCQTVFLVHPKTFIRQKSYLGYFSTVDIGNNKLFFHESNADEYIWRNKRTLSYEDIKSISQSAGTPELGWDKVISLAKERSKQ